METNTLLSDALKEIKAAKEQYERLVTEKGTRAVKQEILSIFDEFPHVKKIAWKQYTPYFNDGDPCVFAIHEIQWGSRLLNSLPELMTWLLEDDGLAPPSAISRACGGDLAEIPQTPALRNTTEEILYTNAAITSLLRILVEHADIALAAFGDHAKVIADSATRSIIIESYDHE